MTRINRNPAVVTVDDVFKQYIDNELATMYRHDPRMVEIIASHLATIASTFIDPMAFHTIGEHPLRPTADECWASDLDVLCPSCFLNNADDGYEKVTITDESGFTCHECLVLFVPSVK